MKNKIAAFMKRYTILNFYVRGSNQTPQYGHALNNLWKQVDTCEDKEAVASFKDWAYNHEVEVMLQGGDDESMENLYDSLSKIKGILSSKFNEPGMRNTCAVVSFVASQRVVVANNYVRNNRLNPANAAAELAKTSFSTVDDVLVLNKVESEDNSANVDRLTEDEIFVVSNIAFLPLAS